VARAERGREAAQGEIADAVVRHVLDRRVEQTLGGRTDVIDIEVQSAERPTRIVERNVGANGRRVATGTYALQELPDGGTRVAFEYRWQTAPLGERLAAPLVRTFIHRQNARAMERLAEQLAGRVTE